MTKKPRPEPDDPEQSQRFVDTAKELETDETGSCFDRAFTVVKSSHVPPHPSASKSKGQKQ